MGSYTVIVPTASSIKIKFPEFESVSNGTVEMAIEEASLSVSDSWLQKYATLGIMYLTAHYLMVTISRADSGTGAILKSESMDGMSKSYDTTSTKPDHGDYTTTPYGSKYLELQGKNFPGVMVV